MHLPLWLCNWIRRWRVRSILFRIASHYIEIYRIHFMNNCFAFVRTHCKSNEKFQVLCWQLSFSVAIWTRFGIEAFDSQNIWWIDILTCLATPVPTASAPRTKFNKTNNTHIHTHTHRDHSKFLPSTIQNIGIWTWRRMVLKYFLCDFRSQSHRNESIW